MTDRYGFIDAEKAQQITMIDNGVLDAEQCLSLVGMCEVLEVSTSGF